jgi:hypothetical protein
MVTEKLKELAHSDAANHTTLLVRRSASAFTATLLQGNGTYMAYEEHNLEQLLARVAETIRASSSHSTGSLVIGIDLVAQGTVIGPHGPGPGPGGDDWVPALQSGVVDVHVQVRGLAEKVQLAQRTQLVHQEQLAQQKTGGG